MKFALAILLVLAVASPLYADQFKLPPSGSGALAKELQEFIDLVPLKKMIGVTKAYYHNDREFKLLMSFMRTPELKQYILDIENAPETKELMNYIEEAGLDIYRIVNIMNKILNLAPVGTMDESEFKMTGGIEGYIKDIGDLTSSGELEALLDEKMENSKVFSDYVKFLTKPRYVSLYLSLHKNQNYLKLKEKVVQSGIDGQVFDTYSSVYIAASFIVL